MSEATSLGTNDDNIEVSDLPPYLVEVTIEGTSDMLFKRWQDSVVADQAAAPKGSKAKKTDNVEASVYRNADGEICLPGVYLVGTLTNRKNGVAKYRQDPRNPRASALELYRAGVVTPTALAPITKVTNEVATTWDYLDSRRAVISGSITRVRPAFLAGWRATVQLSVLIPEYLPPPTLLEDLVKAGRLVGVGDYRPVFGRFNVVKFEVITLE